MHQRTILSVDYHDENCVVRHYDGTTGKESLQTIPTRRDLLKQAVSSARQAAAPGQLIWIQESTTGWVRCRRSWATRWMSSFWPTP